MVVCFPNDLDEINKLKSMVVDLSINTQSSDGIKTSDTG